jgi:cell division protein FtsZ
MNGIPKVDVEEYEIPQAEEDVIQDESGGALKIGIIGGGQCGGRVVEAFYALGYKKAIVCNTTSQDKHSIPDFIELVIPGSPGGAGKNMKVAKQALNDHQDEVYNRMSEVFGKVDHIFVCAGLGGGTGGGIVSGLLELGKKYMAYIGWEDAAQRVGAIVTLPTVGEASSPLVSVNAYNSGTSLSAMADKGEISPVIVVDNDKIKKLYKGLTVAKFYPTINNTIAQLFHVFNWISKTGSDYITFDSTDFMSVLKCGGHLIMGVTVVTDYKVKTGISAALRSNLTKTLLASDFDLSTAKVAAVVIVAGKSIMEEVPGLMDNIEYGFDTIANLTGNATVHRGIYADEGRDNVCVYTMISGLTAPEKRYTILG